MRAFDTNGVVRVLVRDDPVQCEVARSAWVDALASGGAFLSKVLAELAWVLGSSFKMQRRAVVDLLRTVISFEGVVVEDEAVVLAALDAFNGGVAGFSDCLVLATARAANALPLVTFDVGLAREADVRLLPSE